jgi:hypothetical protein
MRDMRKSLLMLAFVLTGLAVQAQDCGPYAFRSYNISDSAGVRGTGLDTFALSQDYPKAMPAKPAAGYPWEKSDFRAGAGGYMRQVLDYCFEGMDSAKWVAQNNKVRTWYHAPWLDYGYMGREFSHGLRMDRTSFPGDLFSKQKNKHRNYSITYYNAEAAYTIGQVWCNPNKPDPTKANFPVGSVWFKLVFTTADTAEVPSLLNAVEWEAFVETGADQPMDPKRPRKLRLIAVDFGVRSAAKEAVNGWVFGSYIFEGHKRGQALADKFVPVGLQWGNDPGLTPQKVIGGAPIAESWINTNIWNESNPSSLVQKIGWGYRLQSVVGDHASSMMSMHMTAGWPPALAVAPKGTAPDSILRWHRNIGHGTAFESGQVSLDFCLELVDGMRNHAIANGDSVLGAEYKTIMADILGFVPKDPAAEDDTQVLQFEVKEGLKDSRNLFVFIGFIFLVLVLGGLLAYNFLKK